MSRKRMAKGSARITGAERDKLAHELRVKYEKGASIRQLAEQSGRSYGFVRRVLTETGVTIRRRGGASRVIAKNAPSAGRFRHSQLPPVSISYTDLAHWRRLLGGRLKGVKELPVSIYLGRGGLDSRRDVIAAVTTLVGELGFKLTPDGDPRVGSFWQKFRAKAASPQTQDAVFDRLTKLERTAEVRLLAVPESQANMQNAQGLAAVISSLRDETASVIQLGGFLIVKAPTRAGKSRIIARTMTARELKMLEKHPELLRDPQGLMGHLSHGSGEEEDGQERRTDPDIRDSPRGLPASPRSIRPAPLAD